MENQFYQDFEYTKFLQSSVVFSVAVDMFHIYGLFCYV